ncbi:MAG TPA: TIGR00725 family protein [Candidatus Acidoferrales bacterium]|nr:TIGR00725 family protein [Candidatus Acidoferrales bacterium]
MARRKQILVIGSGKDDCSDTAYDTAYQVGLEIGRRGAVLLTGGLGGVMEAASKGAKEAGGFVIGIIPQDEKSAANPYCDAVIATGIGLARDFLTAYSADAVIIVGGGAGTMIEAAAAYQKRLPIIAVKGSGGTADKLVDNYLDERKIEIIHGEPSAKNAVETALRLALLT